MKAPSERYFERRQVREAIAWAEAGGVAVHRNFDHYHGTRSARGFTMTKPFLHVIGLRPVLEEWSAANGVPVQAIQPEKRRRVAHIDVFGDYALRLLTRVQPVVAATASFEDFRRAGSSFYAQVCEGILADPEVLELAARAPAGQPPPNLLFGAVHYLLLRGVGHPLARLYPSLNGGRDIGEDPYPAFKDFCLANADAISELMRKRTVQTNEVARSSVLQRGFAVVAQRSGLPLALVEIGASAGLNLIGDRYHYSYGSLEVGDPSAEVRIECRLRGDLKPPLEVARVTWRIGIDRNPIDVTDADQALWLRALVWPDQPWRAELLLAAMHSARQDPPLVLRGDALDRLPEAVAAAPPEAALCVYSSFTLYQLGPAEVLRLEGLLADAGKERPIHRLALEWNPSERPYLELQDPAGERVRLANAHHHGQWLEWLDPASATV
ncbi:MAG: DUF2332 domain-containing protein [Candidatus Dormibacteraeota bacterium]|nr:DUF2332 domain-containing protein [Candidatus Dormibacteraeota bacterium]